MIRNWSFTLLRFGLMAAILMPASINAETVKLLNPNCAVCPVVISYTNGEAKDILAKPTVSLMRQLVQGGRQTIKIDLDGTLKKGAEGDADAGYELIVRCNKHEITIRSIADGSMIEITTHYEALIEDPVPSNWRPEIQLRAPVFDTIDKSDDLDTAWKKFKSGALAEHIDKNGAKGALFNKKLGGWIGQVLKNVAAVP